MPIVIDNQHAALRQQGIEVPELVQGRFIPIRIETKQRDLVRHGFRNGLFNGPFDETQVVNLSIEFFVTPDGSGDVEALRFELDNLRLTTVPEPGTAMFFLVIGITVLARRRKI